MENTLKSKLLVFFTVLFMNANFTVRAYLFVFDQNKKLKNVIYGDGYTF